MKIVKLIRNKIAPVPPRGWPRGDRLFAVLSPPRRTKDSPGVELENFEIPCNKIKNVKAQALTEFVLMFPLLFLVFLVLLQFAIVLNNGTKTQMAVWLGLRGVSIPEGNGFFGSSGKYSEDKIRSFIKEDFYYNKGDDVDINYSSSSYLVISKTEIEIKSRVPYLYGILRWDLIQKAFSGIVKDGKIEAKVKAGMLKF